MPVWNRFASCSLPEEYIFPRSFYAFLAIFTSGKIDSDVVFLQFALNMARFGNVNADEYTSARQNEKSKQTTKYAIHSLSVAFVFCPIWDVMY